MLIEKIKKYIQTTAKNENNRGYYSIRKATGKVNSEDLLKWGEERVLDDGRYDNSIIQRHNAEIRYPNTIHSSYDKCLSTLGVFEDPIFIDYDGEIVPCGYYRKPISNGDDYFFFRLMDRDILIKQYDNKTYNTHLFAYSVDERKFVSVYHNSDTVIQFDKYKNYIVFISVDGNYFYYLDERSGFKLKKENKPSVYGGAHISEDGEKLLFGGYGKPNSCIFDISLGEPKLVSERSYSTFLPPIKQPELPDHYHFYYSSDNSKQSQVMNKYVKMHPELESRIIENEFSDDIAVNYDVRIPTSNKEALALCNYIDQFITKYVMYGFSPSTIVDVAGETYRYYMYMHSNTSQGEIAACKEILRMIMDRHQLTSEDALMYIYNNYCAYESVTLGTEDNWGKQIYDLTFQQMVNDGEASVRWKSELQMYALIHKYFASAIYQYRDYELLGMQSFDAYLPDLRIAFEYQGKQHYEPIEFFGGKEGFDRLRERDIRKKEICKSNSITLIEWKYDEPISPAELRRKMTKHGIFVEQTIL